MNKRLLPVFGALLGFAAPWLGLPWVLSSGGQSLIECRGDYSLFHANSACRRPGLAILAWAGFAVATAASIAAAIKSRKSSGSDAPKPGVRGDAVHLSSAGNRQRRAPDLYARFFMNKGIFAANLAGFASGLIVTHASFSYGIAAFILAGISLGIFVTLIRVKESGAIGLARATERAQLHRLTTAESAIGSSLASLMAAPLCYMLFASLFL